MDATTKTTHDAKVQHHAQDRAKHEEAKHGRMERHSGTGRTDSLKRQGSGKGNWGSVEDEIREAVEDM